MDLSFVKCAIQDFVEQGNKLFVRFFGSGEPTIKLNEIQEICAYCRQIDPKAKFELQTNGVFDENVRNWLAENIDIIWVSYDGITEANDFYRISAQNKSVTSLVKENIRYFSDKISQLGVRSTIGIKNLYHQKDIVDNMHRLNVKYVYTDLMFADVQSKRYSEPEISPMEYAKEYLKAKRYADTLGVFYGSFFCINFDKKTELFCRACLPMPHLTTDGHVSCCDMGYEAGKLDALIYGKYNKEKNKIEYDLEKIRYIQNRKISNMEMCKICEVRYHCGGGCIGEAINETGSMYKIKNKNCEAIKFLAKELIPCEIPVIHP